MGVRLISFDSCFRVETALMCERDCSPEPKRFLRSLARVTTSSSSHTTAEHIDALDFEKHVFYLCGT